MYMSKQLSGFRSLIVWKEAKALALKIYQSTKKFPQYEQFHLTLQLRRAATSAMTNLAEGSAMTTRAHRNSYYTRAKGSVVEVDNFTELVHDLRYISTEEYDDIVSHCARLAYLIEQLKKSK